VELSKYVETALLVHAAASAITGLTPTPKDDNIVRKLYRVIEVLAFVTKRTKQR
jgi:hypothetical protein